MTRTESHLENLIAFPSVSRNSNLDLIHYIRQLLQSLNIDSTLIHDQTGGKANLFASIGPDIKGGVVLSGHTDVVPVDGQDWSMDPFVMHLAEDRIYGRGSTDMKGFIASVLAMIEAAAGAELKRPIHLAFSYDEEIGCVGVKSMLDMLESAPVHPAFCIIGEPTSLRVAIAHKGKTGAICRCQGVESHSALSTQGLNAINMASRMIEAIRSIQIDIAANHPQDDAFTVPHTTLHVGTISGGTALNIVPGMCEFKFEIRNLESDSPEAIMARVRDVAREIVEDCRGKFPSAQIDIEVFNTYPSLDTQPEEAVVDYVRQLVDGKDPVKIDFGTEGGLFQKRLGVPTVVCGPGSMDQGHKPDEFIHRSELVRCDRFLERLLAQLCS